MLISRHESIICDINKAVVTQIGGVTSLFFYRFPRADNIFVVQKDSMLVLLGILKENEFFSFSYLSDLFVIDNFGKEYRFILVCRVTNFREKTSAMVVCANIEAYPFASISDIFPSSEWPEREA